MNDLISAGDRFGTFEQQDKVLVALSGGVDSSVCVRILQEQGFEVRAAVLRFSPAHDRAVEAAQLAARQLGVPLTVEDCGALFEREVVEPFCEAYCAGVTPSPCVLCNPRVKFRVLAELADRMGIPYIATGHYARVEEDGGVYYVCRAASAERDQSYMLYGLGQEILSRLCLPVGEFEKPDIRAMAAEAGLSSADAPDSQEICFIPDGDYAGYIAARGMSPRAGRLIGPNGEDLGAHKGVSHYTVGQRRGVGVAYGEPVFVSRILPNGDVQLARDGAALYAPGAVLRALTHTGGGAFAPGETLEVKIRSRAMPAPCTVSPLPDGALEVRFAQPLRAPAPGQAAVLYRGERVVGGGIIDSVLDV